MNLKEWTIRYIKNRDIYFKKLVELTDEDEVVKAEFKDKTIFYYCTEQLTGKMVEEASKQDNKALVCDYKMSNIQFVIDNWNKLIKIYNLVLIFVDTTKGNKLLLNPQSHSKVADPEKIKEGLISLYESGQEI